MYRRISVLLIVSLVVFCGVLDGQYFLLSWSDFSTQCRNTTLYQIPAGLSLASITGCSRMFNVSIICFVVCVVLVRHFVDDKPFYQFDCSWLAAVFCFIATVKPCHFALFKFPDFVHKFIFVVFAISYPQIVQLLQFIKYWKLICNFFCCCVYAGEQPVPLLHICKYMQSQVVTCNYQCGTKGTGTLVVLQ